MPRPPRKAFRTRRRAFQLGMEKVGIYTSGEITPGIRVRIRENAKGYLKGNEFKTRMMVSAVVVAVIIATVFVGIILK